MKHIIALISLVLLIGSLRSLFIIKVNYQFLNEYECSPMLMVILMIIIAAMSGYYLGLYCAEIFPKIKNKFNNSK